MALDPANFISELIISGPGAPQGTEDISEGDDQIVTVKRATQQSFPNVDAAVTADAAAMNDQPEKSADETIGGSWIFNGLLTMGAIIVARLQNDVALEGKEAGDIIAREMLKMSTLDEIRLGNLTNDLILDAFQQMVMQVGGAKVLSLDATANNSDVPFRIQGVEYFSGSVTRLTAGFDVVSPNAAGFTWDGSDLTHNFNSTDYTVVCSTENSNSRVYSSKGLNSIVALGQTATSGQAIEWMIARVS